MISYMLGMMRNLIKQETLKVKGNKDTTPPKVADMSNGTYEMVDLGGNKGLDISWEMKIIHRVNEASFPNERARALLMQGFIFCPPGA